MVRRGVFSFVACFKWGFPSCLRGPLGLSPTQAFEVMVLIGSVPLVVVHVMGMLSLAVV
jgi:hypothetical protein